MTITANSSSFSGVSGVLVQGQINPVPTTTTENWIVISVLNPYGSVVYATEVRVSQIGQFNATFVTGGSSSSVAGEYSNAEMWVNETYTVYAVSHQGVGAKTQFPVGRTERSRRNYAHQNNYHN